MTAENSSLKITVYWGDVLYDVAVLRSNQAITVGRESKNRYILDHEGINKTPSFELVRVKHDCAELMFEDTFKGHVKIDDKVVSLSKARMSSKVTRDDKGTYHYRLEKADKADMVIGLVSFYFEWTNEREILPLAPFFRDRLLLPLFVPLIALMVAGLMYLQDVVPEPEKAPLRIVTLISKPEMARAAIGEKKSKSGGAQGGASGKATVRPKMAPSQAAKLRNSNLGSLVSGLTAIGKEAPNLKRHSADNPSSTTQTGTGGFSTEGLKRGGGGKTSGLGRTVGQGTGGFQGTGRLGLAGNAPSESGTGLGQELPPANSVTGLDREVIDAIIRRRQARIRLCYERQLNFNPKLAGKVGVHFVIGKTGQVTSRKVIEDTMRNDSVSQCILDEIGSWTFPAPRGGVNVDVDYPFFFESSTKR